MLKNMAYVNVFSHEICHDDMAIFGDAIAGFGTYQREKEMDVQGKALCLYCRRNYFCP